MSATGDIIAAGGAPSWLLNWLPMPMLIPPPMAEVPPIAGEPLSGEGERMEGAGEGWDCGIVSKPPNSPPDTPPPPGDAPPSMPVGGTPHATCAWEQKAWWVGGAVRCGEGWGGVAGWIDRSC